MAADACVLLLGDHEDRLAEWAERLGALGFRTVRAKTTQDALAIAEQRGHRFRAALVEADIAVFDLAGALDTLRRHRSADRLQVIAVGCWPGDDTLDRLREARIERALWEPLGDHALRFELNRAFGDAAPGHVRGDLRIPTEWHTRIFVAGREKQGSVYSISAHGAFIETQRPSMRGAKAVIELPLPSGAVRLAGTVMYANVAGNLQKKNLPTGMALRFDDMRDEHISRIRELIAERAEAHCI